MNRKLLYILICIFSLSIFYSPDAFAKKDRDNKYEKFFKGKKNVKTTEGFIKTHIIDNKIYMEFPLGYLKKDMMISSTLSEISDMMFCVPGRTTMMPRITTFTINADKFCARRYLNVNYSDDENIKNAMKDSHIDPIFFSTKIIAYTPNRRAVLVDVTDLFVTTKDRRLDIISVSSRAKLSKKLDEKRCFIEGVKSFDNNITIISKNTRDGAIHYKGKTYFSRPVTSIVKRSLILLPHKPMKKRIADTRISVNPLFQRQFNPGEPAKVNAYCRRWRIEPVDEIAHKNGELVDVQKPITFYMDPLIPKYYHRAIKESILEWNKAFEKIGFKDVLRVKYYPTKSEDPDFDPDNLNYNCIKYYTTDGRYTPKTGMEMTIDPRTGEILNCNMFFNNSMARGIYLKLLSTLSDVDPKYRRGWRNEDGWIDNESVYKYMRGLLPGSVGLTLGYYYHFSAAASYRVEDYKNPEFLRKNDLAPSVMDMNPINSLAEKGDKERGVLLFSQGKLGIFDYYLTKWMYSPIYEANTPEEEVPILNKWIKEHEGDKRFRVRSCKQSEGNGVFDLGDDPMKAANISKRKAKYIIPNIDKWIPDSEDNTYLNRYIAASKAYGDYRLWLTVSTKKIFGCYKYNKKEGDNLPQVQYHDYDTQKKYAEYYFKELRDYMYGDYSWMYNKNIHKEFEFRIAGKHSHLPYFKLLNTVTPGGLLRYENVPGKHYKHIDFLTDLCNVLFESTKQGKKIDYFTQCLQADYVKTLGESCKFLAKGEFSGGSASPFLKKDGINLENASYFDFANIDIEEAVKEMEINQILSSYENEYEAKAFINDFYPEDIFVTEFPNNNKEDVSWKLFYMPRVHICKTRHQYYELLSNKIYPILKQAVKNCDKSNKAHFELLFNKVSGLLDL